MLLVDASQNHLKQLCATLDIAQLEIASERMQQSAALQTGKKARR
jgi:hypothetical protein